MKLLIGSRALKYHGEKFINESSKRNWDWDWIVSYQGYESLLKSLKNTKRKAINSKKIVLYNNECIHEVDIAFSDSHEYEILNIAKQDPSIATLHESGEYYVASPDLVFSLKKSHRFLKNSPFFLKTIIDYNHLKNLGCKVPDSLKEWYNVREKNTYTYKHPVLKGLSKDDFFIDSIVPYKYDHDTIHLAVKHLDQPAYNYFKPDKNEIECSKEMFFSCSDDIKLYSVLEESYVLALERSQIPNNFDLNPDISFNIALEKVCTSITSGWWREWAYDHYFEAKKMYSKSYVDKFKEALNNGTIKPYKTKGQQ